MLISSGVPAQRRQELVGQRLPALGLPGRAVPLEGRPGPLRRPTRAGMDRALRRQQPRRPRDLNEMQAARARRTPRPLTRIAQYELAFRMQIVGARGDGHHAASRERILEDVRRPAGRRRASPTTACWPAGWSSRACGSSSSSTGAGTSTAPAPSEDIVDGLPKKCATMDRPVAAPDHAT